MPTQTLFLDNTGLTQLLNDLGQYLKGKEEKRLVVTIDTSLQNITADKTYNEIAAAYNNGSNIILDALGYFYKLITVDGNYFCFELRPYDEPGVSYYLTLNPNNTWTLTNWSGQLNLVSGTSIKTINNTSILGSGNIEVLPKKFIIDITKKGARFTYSKTYAEIMAAYNTGADIEIHESFTQYIYRLVNYNEDEECFSFVADDDTDPLTKYWWKVNSNDEWDTDETLYQLRLLSGLTIKTINNTSLLGSGNISISGGSADLTNYYTKSEIDTMIGDIETILASI